MKNISRKVLSNMLEDIQKNDFISFLDIYSDYINSEELQYFVRNYNKANTKNTREYFMNNAKQEFSKLLFRTIREDNTLKDFTDIVREEGISDLSHIVSLYDKYMELSNKNEHDRAVSLAEYPSEIQERYVTHVPWRYFKRYFNLASTNVQNSIFKDTIDPLEYPLPRELDDESLENIDRCINLKWKDYLELSDNKYEALELLDSDLEGISEKVDIGKYFEKFIKENFEDLNKDKAVLSEHWDKYTGECKLKLLGALDIEQKEGEVFKIDYSAPTRNLEELLDVSKKYKLSCGFVIKNCSELPIDNITILQEYYGIDIHQVRFSDYGLDETQEKPYTLQEYIDCRRMIDKITENIENYSGVLKGYDPNKEKKLCCRALRLISNLVSYNYEYVERSDANQTTKEEDIINRNLIGALLHGKAVCAGYAEAGRNVLSCMGIECRNVSADNIDRGEHGHAWNLVKLDGEWYNVDLTWDADALVEELQPKYLLKSDEDFKNHDNYIPRHKTEKCNRTEPEVYYYLFRSRVTETTQSVITMRDIINASRAKQSEVSNNNQNDNKAIASKENNLDEEIDER